MLPLLAAEAAIGGIQAGIGLAQSISANKRLKSLMNQREVYQTPQTVYDSLNISKNQAQYGLSADAISYLTNQNDRSLTSSLGTLAQLGGNANQVAGIYDNSFQNIFKTTLADEGMRFKKFNKLYENMDTLAKSLDAEWSSKDSLLKDKMAMEAQKAEAGQKNMQSGLNMGLSALSQNATNNLFSTEQQKNRDAIMGAGQGIKFDNIPTLKRQNIDLSYNDAMKKFNNNLFFNKY